MEAKRQEAVTPPRLASALKLWRQALFYLLPSLTFLLSHEYPTVSSSPLQGETQARERGIFSSEHEWNYGRGWMEMPRATESRSSFESRWEGKLKL